MELRLIDSYTMHRYTNPQSVVYKYFFTAVVTATVCNVSAANADAVSKDYAVTRHAAVTAQCVIYEPLTSRWKAF
eukprot:13026-Heterococcus_DN1.PRE.6